MKTCTKCGKRKPNTNEYFPIDKGKLIHWCIPCRRKYGRSHYRKNQEVYKTRALTRYRKSPEQRRKQVRLYYRKTIEQRRAYDHWRYRDPKRKAAAKDRYFRRAYGISLEEYMVLAQQQGGLCACCGKMPLPGQRLVVDHSHSHKEVRGLLCDRCNPGLGFFQDDIELLKKAIAYLERHAAKRALNNVVAFKRRDQ